MSNKPAPKFPKPHSNNAAQDGQLLNEIQTEVSNEAAPFLEFLTKHAISIMCILGIFVLAVAGLGAYNWHQDNTMEKAQAELATITSTTKGDDQVAALEAFLAKAPKDLHIAIVLSQADACMAEKSYEKAATYYAKLATMDANGAVGLLAGLNQAQALITADKPKDAVPILEALIPKAPEGYAVVIQQTLAEAALQSEDFAKAQATLEALANASMGAVAEVYRFRARQAEEQKNEQKK